LGEKNDLIAYYLRNGIFYNKDLQVKSSSGIDFTWAGLHGLCFDFRVLATGFLRFQLIPWERTHRLPTEITAVC